MDGSFLTPEDFEKIMGASAFPEEQQALMAQLQAAEQLRGQQPQMRDMGRVSVAANPLEHIAAMLKDQRANRSTRDTLANQKALIEELRKARTTYGRNVMQPQGPQLNNPGNPDFEQMGMM